MFSYEYTQFLFDAINELSAKYLNEKWTGSIEFCSLPVHQIIIRLPLGKTCMDDINICDYLGQSKYPSVHRLYLDPEKYDKPPLIGESIAKNPHPMKLRSALEAAAHYSGSPIMSDGGRSNFRSFKSKKLRNRRCIQAKEVTKERWRPSGRRLY